MVKKKQKSCSVTKYSWFIWQVVAVDREIYLVEE